MIASIHASTGESNRKHGSADHHSQVHLLHNVLDVVHVGQHPTHTRHRVLGAPDQLGEGDVVAIDGTASKHRQLVHRAVCRADSATTGRGTGNDGATTCTP